MLLAKANQQQMTNRASIKWLAIVPNFINTFGKHVCVNKEVSHKIGAEVICQQFIHKYTPQKICLLLQRLQD